MSAEIDNSYHISTNVQDRVWNDVLGERKRQDEKFGDQTYITNELWNVIGVE